MNENIMSEERYKQIKDSIELQSLVKSQTGVEDELLQEEIELLNAYEKLKEKLDKYENPKDMTLFAMWCTEKVKDENKQLKEDIKNIIKILNKNCADLEATEEEFESLDRWQNENN